MIKSVKYKNPLGLKGGRSRNSLGITKSKKIKSRDPSVQR